MFFINKEKQEIIHIVFSPVPFDFSKIITCKWGNFCFNREAVIAAVKPQPTIHKRDIVADL